MPTIKKVNPFDENFLRRCSGYDPKFIDGKTPVSVDILGTQHKGELALVKGSKKNILDYSNLSVWYNKNRKVPFVSAYNIDGSKKKKVSRNSINFKIDPRIPRSVQLEEDVFYAIVTNITEFEIGHMASHNEMAWGDTLNSKIRCFQTFHYPNSVPQVERLNTGLWSKLESYVIKESKETGTQRINVFTGPMLKDSDPTYLFDKKFKVPLFFYKVIVFQYKKKLYTTGYVMSQYKRAIELGLISPKTKAIREVKLRGKTSEPFSDYNHRDVFQVNIELIEEYTGLRFNWSKVNRVEIEHGERKLEEISETGGTKERKLRSPKVLDNLDSDIEGMVTNMVLPGKSNN